MKTFFTSLNGYKNEFINFKEIVFQDVVYQIYIDGIIDGIDDNNYSAVLFKYIKYGDKINDYLRGSYSLIIINEYECFISKDHLGLRPIYYCYSNDNLMVSNSIKCLLDIGNIDPIVSSEELLELFSLGPSISEDRTLLKGIKQIPMGHFLHYNYKSIDVVKFYDLVAKSHVDSLADTALKINALIKDSCDNHSNTRTSFLSGGIDSSILCKIASSAGLTTYSLDYEGNSENFKGNNFQVSLDDTYIDIMQKAINSNHHSLIITQQELIKLLDDALLAREYPGMADIDSSLYWLCSKVQDASIFSGECSDEIFGGYPWFYKESYLNSTTFPWLTHLDERKKLINNQFKCLDITSYIDRCYNKAINQVSYLPTDSEDDRRARLNTYITVHYFMQTLVTRQVCMSRANDIDIVAPFANVELFDYVYNIPWHLKFHNNLEKGILRYSFKDELPFEIAYRKKNPFPKTHNPVFAEMISKQLSSCLDDPTSILHELFDQDALLELIETKGSSYNNPWYGQLMSGPQLLAYIYQIHYWFKSYNITLEK
ncbi:MAG: asparagine synthase-related protein [Erysipelotrichaceae bacterium]